MHKQSLSLSFSKIAPITTLPAEITFMILEMTLEVDSSPKEFRATLRAAALVQRSWRDPAQALLLLSRYLDFDNKKACSSGSRAQRPDSGPLEPSRRGSPTRRRSRQDSARRSSFAFCASRAATTSLRIFCTLKISNLSTGVEVPTFFFFWSREADLSATHASSSRLDAVRLEPGPVTAVSKNTAQTPTTSATAPSSFPLSSASP